MKKNKMVSMVVLLAVLTALFTGCGDLMDVIPYCSPNSLECIRCGECVKVCPTKAIENTLKKGNGDKR